LSRSVRAWGDKTGQLEKSAREVAKQMQERWGAPLVMIAIDTVVAAACLKDESSAAESQAAMNVLNELAKRLTCTIEWDIDGSGTPKAVKKPRRWSKALSTLRKSLMVALAEQSGHPSRGQRPEAAR
jgi:hypothetical protein